jgi:hypothetical protein
MRRDERDDVRAITSPPVPTARRFDPIDEPVG